MPPITSKSTKGEEPEGVKPEDEDAAKYDAPVDPYGSDAANAADGLGPLAPLSGDPIDGSAADGANAGR